MTIIAQTHDDVLEAIAEALDITPSQYGQARNKYEAVGNWLGRDESAISTYAPVISPQGSFLLGTVIRPLSDTDEYDIDLVCLLKGLSKEDITQKELKEVVGREILLYARAQRMEKRPEEGRRCWTLHYADGTHFHMDVLPALPDAERIQQMFRKRGHDILAGDQGLSGHAIAITDNTMPEYSQYTDDWPQSNPMGYAAWFRRQMAAQLAERKGVLAKRQQLTASVDEIPDHEVKTPLQQAIQLLKRHRDLMFADDDEQKPISIIITTLAGHAYQNESTISAAIRSILTNMDRYIEYRGEDAWIVNPVNPEENFADKWAERPRKRENFYKWLEQARKDFASYLRGSQFDDVPQALKEGLGIGLVDRTLRAIIQTPASGTKGTSQSQKVERTKSAVGKFQQIEDSSQPWARR